MKSPKQDHDCNACVHKLNSIFSHLTDSELEEVEYEKSCNFFKKDNYLYHEGTRINGFYCINSGIIKLFKTGVVGKDQIIKFASKGDIIGYRSILSQEPACTTAKVIEDTSLCYIPASLLLKLVNSNQNFSMEILKLACKELGDANNFITDIAQKTVRERLAEVLIILKDQFDLDKDGNLQITLTRNELASIVGTATESVIRLLSEFKADKLVELKGKKIKIINLPGLIKLSNTFN